MIQIVFNQSMIRRRSRLKKTACAKNTKNMAENFYNFFQNISTILFFLI